MTDGLDTLLDHPLIWKAGERSDTDRGFSTGHAFLDEHLPGGGFPRGALTEIVVERYGIGEMSLLIPGLARLSRQPADDPEQGGWIGCIAPPWPPYAPALAAAGVDLSRLLLVHPQRIEEALWAMEQALRSGTCAVVLCWVEQVREAQLRRLQLAAESAGSLGILFRPPQAMGESTPAALRLYLAPGRDGLEIRITKRRGGRPVTLSAQPHPAEPWG